MHKVSTNPNEIVDSKKSVPYT